MTLQIVLSKPQALVHIEVHTLVLSLKRFMPKHSRPCLPTQPDIGECVREMERKHSQMLPSAKLKLQIISAWCCSLWLEVCVEQEHKTTPTQWKAAARKILHRLGARSLKFLILLRNLSCIPEKSLKSGSSDGFSNDAMFSLKPAGLFT